jgi:hypothetical protein
MEMARPSTSFSESDIVFEFSMPAAPKRKIANSRGANPWPTAIGLSFFGLPDLSLVVERNREPVRDRNKTQEEASLFPRTMSAQEILIIRKGLLMTLVSCVNFELLILS